MTDSCAECGNARKDGWLLVNGYCLECRPDLFHERRMLLKRQLTIAMKRDDWTGDDAA